MVSITRIFMITDFTEYITSLVGTPLYKCIMYIPIRTVYICVFRNVRGLTVRAGIKERHLHKYVRGKFVLTTFVYIVYVR